MGRIGLLLSSLNPARPARVDASLPREGESIAGIVGKRGVRADYLIDHESGCWVWQKSKVRGYPMGRAHRLYFKRAYGDAALPDDHDCHHVCRNPACVNPEHLEAVPRLTHLIAHRNIHNLSEQDVLDIRAAGSDPRVRLTDLSDKYGLTPNNIWYIWTARSYGHLGGPVKLDYSCEWCGKKLPPESSRHRRHCNQNCVSAASKARARARKKAA